MDVVDRAAAVTEAWLDTVHARFRRDAESLHLGALLGPVLCCGCGEQIPAERRAAMPAATKCVACQEAAECSRGCQEIAKCRTCQS